MLLRSKHQQAAWFALVVASALIYWGSAAGALALLLRNVSTTLDVWRDLACVVVGLAALYVVKLQTLPAGVQGGGVDHPPPPLIGDGGQPPPPPTDGGESGVRLVQQRAMRIRAFFVVVLVETAAVVLWTGMWGLLSLVTETLVRNLVYAGVALASMFALYTFFT